jgi:hypothetical protein
MERVERGQLARSDGAPVARVGGAVDGGHGEGVLSSDGGPGREYTRPTSVTEQDLAPEGCQAFRFQGRC